MKRTFETMCGMSPRIHELNVSGPLYKYCQENSPAGVVSSGWLSVGIWFVDYYGDECIAAWNHGNGWSGAARHAVNYTASGRPYINKGRARWYLDEAMRAA